MELATLDDVNRIEGKQDRMEKMMILMLRHPRGRNVVTVKDIAEMEGESTTKLYQGARYLLPRFGQSAYPEGYARWPLEEYLAWSARDPEERHREWLQHLESERKREVKNLQRATG